MIADRAEAYHRQQADVAASQYIASLANPAAAQDWHKANVEARREIISTLRASAYLTDIPAALMRSGAHIRALRALMAPPISQDQFALLCPSYSKSAENSGRPLSAPKAAGVTASLMRGRDRRLTRWLDRVATPRRLEIRILLHAISPILSQQIVATVRRGRMSAQQEGAVVAMLNAKSWTQSRSALIETLTDVPAHHFMHKTLFATGSQPQEVDIACGLGKTVVLAMECKVTNDATNSVKRVNDVLKKATAWRQHWGAFVRTAALLQGVVGYKDVARLLAADVEVF